MSSVHTNLILDPRLAVERQRDLIRSAERDRILRDAGIPTSIDVYRLSLGRVVVRVGELIAGRPSLSRGPKPLAPAAPALPPTPRLAR